MKHGTCCNCPDCGELHDDCTCRYVCPSCDTQRQDEDEDCCDGQRLAQMTNAVREWAEARKALETFCEEWEKQRRIHNQRVPVHIRVQQAKDEERLSSALEEASEALAALTKHEGEE